MDISTSLSASSTSQGTSEDQCNEARRRRTKQDKDKKVQNFPDYLRFVARKSKAGFDKVHDELTKLYSTEKRMQRQKSAQSSQTESKDIHHVSQATSPGLDTRAKGYTEHRNGKRMSIRKQWARSAKTSTLWMSTGANIPTTGSFISYISEDMDLVKGPAQRELDIEKLKEELVIKTNNSEQPNISKEVEFGSKSFSANHVQKDRPIFTFDKLTHSRSLDYDPTLPNSPVESYPEQCHDYVNIQELVDSPNGKGNSPEQTDCIYDVPKRSLKPPIKPKNALKIRQEKKENTTTTATNTIQNKASNLETTSNEPCSHKSIQDTVDDDYLPMDDVRIDTSSAEKNKQGVQEAIKEMGNEANEDMDDSGDYVLPDLCIDKSNGKLPTYTQLGQNDVENIYASIDRDKKERNCNDEKEEDIYANSTMVMYDDFDNLTENDVLPRDSGCIYDVPPPISIATEGNEIFEDNTPDKNFFEFSVSEVVKCLDECALPRLASICEQEQLDGHFFENFDESQFIREPFLLNWFHIAKLRRILLGWRPKQ